MTYPRHLYRHPGPFGRGATSYRVAGASNAEAEAVLLSQGWSLTKPDPLDHDHDGEKGGSKTPGGDLKALRAEYAEKIGKRPFPGWDEAELRRRMAG